METAAVTPAVRKGFFRRLMSWRGALFLLAAFITLAALLLAEENWRGARAWQNYKREMEAKGERFDIARLIPPKVPDDQNFAMTPYFAPVFNLPPEVLRQPPKLVTNMVNGREVVEPMQIVRGTNIASHLPDPDLPPHRAGWHFGSAADLIAWAVAFQDTNSATPRPEITDPVQAASIVLENMKPYEPTLAELQSANERPYCRFNIPYEEWDNPQVGSALMEHFAMIKELYRLLSLHAEAGMVSGRTGQALNDINVMFRVDDGLKDEPLLISQLVRLACVSILLQPVGEGLAEHRWSEAQLLTLQDRLQKTDLIASIVQSVYGERDICVNQRFDHGNLHTDGLDLFSHSGWGRLEQLNINLAFHNMVLPRIDLAAREINPSVNRSIDLAFKKFADGNWFHLVVIQHAIFAKMMLPAYSRVPQKAAFAQSEVDMAMLACALERYRLAEGQYPEELNALVPRFVAVLPHDIINGQPLKYRRADNGRFILYSVGWNEKDDGGVVATNKDKHQDILQGDWVWQYPEGN
jgi:hypothetical protein